MIIAWCRVHCHQQSDAGGVRAGAGLGLHETGPLLWSDEHRHVPGGEPAEVWQHGVGRLVQPRLEYEVEEQSQHHCHDHYLKHEEILPLTHCLQSKGLFVAFKVKSARLMLPFKLPERILLIVSSSSSLFSLDSSVLSWSLFTLSARLCTLPVHSPGSPAAGSSASLCINQVKYLLK